MRMVSLCLLLTASVLAEDRFSMRELQEMSAQKAMESIAKKDCKDYLSAVNAILVSDVAEEEKVSVLYSLFTDLDRTALLVLYSFTE